MKLKPYSLRSYKNDLRNLLRIMKITFILLFLGISHAFSLTYSQSTQLSLSANRQSIQEIFTSIERESEYVFFFSDDLLEELNRKVDLVANGETLDNILDKLFAGTGLTYKINDRQVSVIRATLSRRAMPNPQNVAQSRQLRGLIKSDDGEPVIGANIMIKGTNTGTSSDLDGNFTLQVHPNAVLQVSYIGYEGIEVNVGTRDFIEIILEESRSAIDEVVIVGYGTQKKVNLTGSLFSINSESIKDRVQTNVLSAIQGAIPGVTVISRPGQSPSINFRGRGNLGDSKPLYVVNGAIVDEVFFSNLDPNSIESISFLKDAASSAIYGSRAAYGVVLVSTKSGNAEKMNVTYNGYVGIKSVTYTPDNVNSWEYAEIMNEGMYNRNPSAGKYQAYTQEEIGWFRDGSRPDYYPNTDWVDLVLDKQVVTTQHSLNLSGGSEKVQFFTGLGYLYDDNYMPGKDSQRYNLDLNVSAAMTSWLKVRAGVKYIRNTTDVRNGTPGLGNFLAVPPIMVAQQSNGEWGSIAGGKQATQTFLQNNPLRTLSKNNWSEDKSENKLIDLGFDITPIKGLTLTGQGVYKGFERKRKSYTGLQDEVKSFETDTEIPGTGIYTNQMDMYWRSSTQTLYTGMARYDWAKDQHNLSVLAGTSYEHFNYERLYMKRQDFPVETMKDIETGATINKDLPDRETPLYENKMLSWFGRINYNFMQRYLFEANIRADASSRFHKDNRWGIFPSFSGGWRISEEEFMDEANWVDNLKLRASWGTLGNINNVGYYDYFQSYTSGANYSFDDEAVKGVIESKPANPNLGWETVTLTDIGLDVDLFNGQLGVTADYYIKNTSDILLGYNVPKETGISSNPSQNIGKVQNKGFEFAVTHRNKIGDFSYTVAMNISTNRNRIKDLGTSDDIIQGGGDKINYILREGESVGSFYGYVTDGLYTQQEIDNGHYYTFGRVPNAGDIKYVPQRENVEWGSAISGDDRTVIGKDVPDFTYGININLQYKNFELGLFGQGVSGTMAAFESEQVSCLFINATPRKFHLKRWTEDNPDSRAVYPRIYRGHSMDDYNQYFSDYQLFDADYFRIKTVSLGYMIPKPVVSKWGLSMMKVFLTGENLFTLRADKIMKDFDPETRSGRGITDYGVKSIAFGVNVSF